MKDKPINYEGTNHNVPKRKKNEKNLKLHFSEYTKEVKYIKTLKYLRVKQNRGENHKLKRAKAKQTNI